jgi:hypothetical protein
MTEEIKCEHEWEDSIAIYKNDSGQYKVKSRLCKKCGAWEAFKGGENKWIPQGNINDGTLAQQPRVNLIGSEVVSGSVHIKLKCNQCGNEYVVIDNDKERLSQLIRSIQAFNPSKELWCPKCSTEIKSK